MIIVVRTAGQTPEAQPTPGSDANPAPVRIAEILLLLQTLAAYGRHLTQVIPHRGLWRGFATVARFFGSAAVPDIAVRVQRGIARALALQAVLLQRAKRGRDLVFPAPRASTSRAASRPRPKPDRPGEKPLLTSDSLPSQAELETWARRRPIGRTITDICLDLGISPSLCAGPFWNRLFEAIQDYNGSLNKLMQELRRREDKFEKEDWKRPHLEWPARTRDAIQQALGFFIGEPPIDPFQSSGPSDPAAALATGPP